MQTITQASSNDDHVESGEISTSKVIAVDESKEIIFKIAMLKDNEVLRDQLTDVRG